MKINNNSQKIMVTLLALTILLVAGCQSTTIPSESEAILSSSEQVLGFAALSAVEELQQDVSDNEIDNTNLNTKKINSRLYIPNMFLNDSIKFNVEVQNNTFRDYDKTMIISYVDMNNNVNTHEFHYNETIIKMDGDEIESEISGIIIVNGVEYTLKGIKEEEEEEFEYDLTAYLDDENYITIKYEVEEKSENEIEKEFEYERFVDKQLVYRMEVEFEVEEDGEVELTIKLLDGDFESEYSFERELENDREEIKIEYKISEAGVVLEEGEYQSYNEINE